MLVGVDETGRGSCFGPVVSCAVSFGSRRLPRDLRSRLADSKCLTKRQRDELYDLLVQRVIYAFGAASAAEIDRINPRQATLLSMRRAILRLPEVPARILIDGIDCPDDLPCPAEAIIKGDQSVPEISAASILAKVFRDRLVARVASRYPHYGIERNAGYGTRAHFDAIVLHGVCKHHRMTFLRKVLEPTSIKDTL